MEGTYRSAPWLRSGILVVTVCAVVGCASGSTNPETNDFSQMVTTTLEEARIGGASQSQIGILEAASSDGLVSVEMVRQATQAAIACMNDSGLDAQYGEDKSKSGLVVPGYSVRLGDTDDAAALAVADACDLQELGFVFRLYSLQPASRELEEEYILSREAALRECLATVGITADPEADGLELAQVAVEAWLSGESGEVDCVEEADI